VNAKYLHFEAQQAHYYVLNPAMALASVPPRAAGLGDRVGTIAKVYDAVDLLSTLEDVFIYRLHPDSVVWGSHSLMLLARPQLG